MKICKDLNGYFVLDNADQKVELFFKGKIVERVPTLASIGLSFWNKNKKGDYHREAEVVLDNNDTSFKSLRYSIFSYFEERETNEQ